MAVDPVCGMQVDEETAEWKSEHMGKTNYFCSPGCKRSFDQNSEQYLQGDHSEGHTGHGHRGSDT